MTDQAWIFDLNGTLVKTQDDFHKLAEVAVLKNHGIEMRPEEISRHFPDIHALEVFRQLAPHLDAHQLLEEKWRQMRLLAIARTIEATDYARQLLRQLHKRGTPMGIASASPLEWIELCLTRIDADRYMGCYASSEEVGGSFPAAFLLAAQRLKCEPKNCIAVVGDLAGVVAAMTTEMRPLWLTTSAMDIHGVRKLYSLAIARQML